VILSNRLSRMAWHQHIVELENAGFFDQRSLEVGADPADALMTSATLLGTIMRG